MWNDEDPIVYFPMTQLIIGVETTGMPIYLNFRILNDVFNPFNAFIVSNKAAERV